jgi:hypothetical protein
MEALDNKNAEQVKSLLESVETVELQVILNAVPLDLIKMKKPEQERIGWNAALSRRAPLAWSAQSLLDTYEKNITAETKKEN